MIAAVVLVLGVLVVLAGALVVARACGPVERFTLHADVDLINVAEALSPEVLVPAPAPLPARQRVAGFREVAA